MSRLVLAASAPARAVRGAPLWRLPRIPLTVLLAVDAAAVAACVVLGGRAPVTTLIIERVVIVAALSLLLIELTAQSARIARFLTPENGYLDNSSVWSFGLALLVPPGVAAVAIAVLAPYYSIRSRGDRKPQIHRVLYFTATVVLATAAAAETIHAIVAAMPARVPHGATYAVAVATALVAYQVVQQGLMGTMMFLLRRPRSWQGLLPDSEQRYRETVFQIIGVLAAQCIIVQPWLSPSVLAVIALVHRGALVRQLQVEATTDAKTNLLNAQGWRRAAQVALEQSVRTSSPVTLLLVDLDHFKRINDTHGHLVGDRVLRLVGDSLQDELRSNDAVGRFGGEEFIVLLTGVDRSRAETIAERLREAIARSASNAEMIVTASVGLAHSTDARVDLDLLIESADSALYVAKAAGRDRVSSRSLV